jgi:hypothetical protein
VQDEYLYMLCVVQDESHPALHTVYTHHCTLDTVCCHTNAWSITTYFTEHFNNCNFSQAQLRAPWWWSTDRNM